MDSPIEQREQSRLKLLDFCDRLATILINERCRLLDLVRAMLEDPEQAVKKFPWDELRVFLKNLHLPLSEVVDPCASALDVVSLAPLLKKLNKDSLNECLSGALLHQIAFQAATQSLITLAISLTGSGISEALASSPFAPMPQEVRNLTPMCGTTASYSKGIVDAPSSTLSKEVVPTLEELCLRREQQDIPGISRQWKRKALSDPNPEDLKTYSGN